MDAVPGDLHSDAMTWLSLHMTVFALGSALALVVARARARDNLRRTALGIDGALLSFALPVLRER